MARPKRNSPNYIGVRFVSNVVSWIEQYYHKFKVFPSDSVLMSQFNMDRDKFDRLQRSALYKKALNERGLVKRNHLTVEQNACIAVMTNFADQRSTEVKLASIGVTPEQFQGWLSHKPFQLELTARSDEIMQNLNADAMAALARKVREGNVHALKMYFEMTGKANSQETVNARMMVTKVMEAIQSHVKDPSTILAITRDVLGENAAFADVTVPAIEFHSNDSPVAE